MTVLKYSLLALAVSSAAGGSCDVIPRADFCLCSKDSDCKHSCLTFRSAGSDGSDDTGICTTTSNESTATNEKRDPCDRSTNDPYAAKDCVLQSSKDNREYTCDGAHYNLDLYIKSTTGDNSYSYLPQQCVIGYNLLRVAGQSVEQCQQLCNDVSSCVAIEYGVDYGGAGLSTKEHTACGEMKTTVPSSLPSTPTPVPATPLAADFEPCDSPEQCQSGGCYNLQGVRKRRNLRALQSRYSSGKTCANPSSFVDSGPDSVCQFPFVFRGQTYDECTIVGDSRERPWCSTKVTLQPGDEYRWHISGGNYIHYCATQAPTPFPTPFPTPPTPAPVYPTPAPQPEIVYVTAPPAPAPAPAYYSPYGGGYPGYYGGYDRFRRPCIGILCF